MEGIEQLAELEFLNLSFNEISDLSYLQPLQDLVHLNLFENGVDLETLPDLQALRSLNVGSNNLTGLDPLAGLQQLVELSAGLNRISSLNPVSDLPNLRQLDLAANLITDLSSLTNLTELRAFDCSLDDIGALSNLSELSYLDLRNNSSADISGLLNNPGLGLGDEIFLQGNPLDTGDCSAINQLLLRDVAIFHDVAYPLPNQ